MPWCLTLCPHPTSGSVGPLDPGKALCARIHYYNLVFIMPLSRISSRGDMHNNGQLDIIGFFEGGRILLLQVTLTVIIDILGGCSFRNGTVIPKVRVWADNIIPFITQCKNIIWMPFPPFSTSLDVPQRIFCICVVVRSCCWRSTVMHFGNHHNFMSHSSSQGTQTANSVELNYILLWYFSGIPLNLLRSTLGKGFLQA